MFTTCAMLTLAEPRRNIITWTHGRYSLVEKRPVALIYVVSQNVRPGHCIPIMTVSAYNSDSTTHCQDVIFGQSSVPLLTCVHPQTELINNSHSSHKTSTEHPGSDHPQ